jgi:assimilatory nitrate reductase catalytic subunit
VLLPAAAWGEKDGTVTNSERQISRQRAFAPPASEAKPDWWAVSEVAKRMGFGAAFDMRARPRSFASMPRSPHSRTMETATSISVALRA